MKIKKLLNSIFLISCTSIGAGMLALPCVTIKNGFVVSSIIFIICWIFMTISSLFFLESTLWFRKRTNVLTIVNQILGYKWKTVTSIIYVCLLYSLISAYIFAYNKWLRHTFFYINSELIDALCILVFVTIIIFVTFNKNKSINKLNFFLSIFLFISYILVIYKCIPCVNIDSISILSTKNIRYIFPVIITSFGFGIIIPTLTKFLKKRHISLYKSIIIGSLIPLGVYIIWLLTIHGIFPKDSEYSLTELDTKNENFDITFMYFIEKITHSRNLFYFILIFSVISIFTSIIGISLSLNDFISDELNFSKHTVLTLIIICIPPIIFSIYYTIGFTKILSFSGMLVSVLLGIIPTSITWYGRYKLKIDSKFKVPGGKLTIFMTYIFFCLIIINEIKFMLM